MINQNKFSVVIPVCNSENTISETIKSVLDQTYKADQIIIIDDGSTDRSAELIKSFQELHKEIDYFYQPNKGVSAARNLGIQKARNENIFFIDSDDYWLKNKIALHNLHLLTHADCMASFTNFISADVGNGNLLHANRYVNKLPINSINLALNLVRINGSSSSFLGKKNKLTELSGFDEQLSFGEDLDLWVRYAQNNKICDLLETCVVIKYNSADEKYTKGFNSISNLYLEIWQKLGINLTDYKLKSAARRILRIEIRRNIRNFSFIFSRYPRKLQNYEQNFLKLIYINYTGYLVFLVYDTFTDFIDAFLKIKRR
jgi:glycosyltransferase involved in cell wall biosynthesis